MPRIDTLQNDVAFIMTTLYGIKQCDTVRAAKKWLDAAGIDFKFHDVREHGIDNADIKRWRKAVDWQSLVNKRSTTWKQLSAQQRDMLNEATVNALLLAHPTLIKRPVLESGSRCLIGFNDTLYRNFFQQD